MTDKANAGVPDGKTAKVFIIDTGARIGRIPTEFLVKPPVQGFSHLPSLPSWSFLVENDTGRRALFDLAIPKDWANLPPAISDKLKTRGWVITADRDVDEVLTANGVSTSSIESVVWRYVRLQVDLGSSLTEYLTVIGTGITSVTYPRSHRAQSWSLAQDSKMPSRRGTHPEKTAQYMKET